MINDLTAELNGIRAEHLRLGQLLHMTCTDLAIKFTECDQLKAQVGVWLRV